MVNKDKSGTERQHRRRQREKEWLAANGWKSWEALHTALMNGETHLTKHAPDVAKAAAQKGVLRKNRNGKRAGVA